MPVTDPRPSTVYYNDGNELVIWDLESGREVGRVPNEENLDIAFPLPSTGISLRKVKNQKEAEDFLIAARRKLILDNQEMSLGHKFLFNVKLREEFGAPFVNAQQDLGTMFGFDFLTFDGPLNTLDIYLSTGFMMHRIIDDNYGYGWSLGASFYNDWLELGKIVSLFSALRLSTEIPFNRDFSSSYINPLGLGLRVFTLSAFYGELQANVAWWHDGFGEVSAWFGLDPSSLIWLNKRIGSHREHDLKRYYFGDK